MKSTTAKASKPKATGTAAPAVVQDSDTTPADQDRSRRIAIAAYLKAESRGFAPGQDLRDWLEAEAEFDQAKKH